MDDIRKNIAEIAFNKGLKQSNLGEIWGCNQSNAGKKLHGASRLFYSDIEAFASAVGMSVVDLITYPDKYAPVGSFADKDELHQKDAVINHLNDYISRLKDDAYRYKAEIAKLKLKNNAND